MADHARFPVHEAIRADYISAVHFGNALMTEADAQNRNVAAKAKNNVLADACFARRARARGNTNVPWSQRCDFINCDFIVAFDQNITAQLAKVLRKVLSEGIVIVDQKNHRFGFLTLSLKVHRRPAP
jgi:hypothetical protein